MGIYHIETPVGTVEIDHDGDPFALIPALNSWVRDTSHKQSQERTSAPMPGETTGQKVYDVATGNRTLAGETIEEGISKERKLGEQMVSESKSKTPFSDFGAITSGESSPLVNPNEPIIKTPEASKQFVQQYPKLSGASNALAEFASGLTTPNNIKLMIGLGTSPAAVQKLAALGFSSEAVKSTAEALGAASVEQDESKKTQLVTSAILNGVMATAMAKHAAFEDAVTPEQKQTAQADLDQWIEKRKADAQANKLNNAGLPKTAEALQTSNEAEPKQAEEAKTPASTPETAEQSAGTGRQAGTSGSETQPLKTETQKGGDQIEKETNAEGEKADGQKEKVADVASEGSSPTDQPKITSTAMKAEDGTVHTGDDPTASHAEIIEDKSNQGIDVTDGEHGFTDGEGNFISRENAAKFALESGQIDQPTYDKAMARTDEKEKGLHSEDLKPENLGPGAANVKEFAERPKISIKNSEVDKERAKRGELPLMEPARKAMGQTWDEAMRKIDRDPEAGGELVKQLRGGKKTDISEVDHAVLLHHKIDISNERETEAARALDPEASEEDRATARLRYARLEDQANEIDQATQKAGTISGRALQIRQLMARDDYSVAAMERKARLAKGGESLTPEENVKIKEQAERIAELEKKLSERQSGTKQRESDKVTDETINRLKGEANRNKPKDPAAERQTLIDSLKSRIKDGSNIRDLSSYVQRLALGFVRDGIKERGALVEAVHGVLKDIVPDITPRETQDAISGYGDFRELSKEESKGQLRDLKGQLQQVSKLEDMRKKGELPSKTGMERRVPSAEERSLMKEVNNVKKELGLESNDPNKLKSSLEANKTRLRNRIEDLKLAIDKNQKIPERSKSKLEDDELKQLKMDRDAAQKEYNAMVGVDMNEVESQKEASLVKTIDELQRQLKTGEVDAQQKSATVDTQKISELKRQRDVLIKQKREIIKSKNPPKTEEEKRIASLEKSIQEARDKISKGDLSVKTGKPTVDTKDVSDAKSALKDLNKQLSELRNPARTPEEIKERQLDKRITDLEDKIAKGDLSTKTGTPTVDTKEIAEKRSRMDALNKQLKDLRKATVKKLSPDEIALKVYKTRTTKRIADIQDKITRGDFSKTPRRTIKLDEEAIKLKAEAQRVKNKFDRGVEVERRNHRGITETVLDTAPKISRAFLLSNPVTFAKLTMAAIYRLASSPVEEAIGAGISKIFPSIASRAPSEGGGSVAIEAKAIADGITKGGKDAWETFRGRGSEIENAYGKQDIMPPSKLDIFGHMHGALKAPVKRVAFSRSLQKRMAHAIANGVDASDPFVQTRIAMEAYKDANRSIFMQDNRVVSAYKMALRGFEKKNEAGEIPIGGKVLTTTARTLLPIVKIPTNIVAETLQYATGSVTGSARLANAFRKGVETLHPSEADLIMRELKKGSIGGAVLLLGYFAPQAIGGYYQHGKKRDPNDLKAGSVKLYDHEVPSSYLHNPLMEQLQLGATIARVANSKLRKKDDDVQGISSGIQAAAYGLTSEVPFIREQIELGKLQDPATRGKFFGELAKSRLDPQFIQWIAKQMDKDEEGNQVKRDPQNIMQHIESGLPLLRENVPEKQSKGFSIKGRKRR